MHFPSDLVKNSKRLWLLAAQIFWSFLAPSAFGVGLAWDPSPDPNVVGYAVYYGTSSGSYPLRVDVGLQTNATIQLPLHRATFFFVATAYTVDGVESLPSNEVSYVVPAASLTNDSGSVPEDPLLPGQVSDVPADLLLPGEVGSAPPPALLTNELSDVPADLLLPGEVGSAPTPALLTNELSDVLPGSLLANKVSSAPPAASLTNEVSSLLPVALLTRETDKGLSRQLQFSVGPDRHWELQASADFLQWDTLYALDAVTNGWIDVFDPVNPLAPLRFYRLVSTPTLARAPDPDSKPGSYVSPGALLISRTANPLKMQLRFSVGPDRPWQLQASEDLLLWTSLCELTSLTSGWIDFFDPVLPSRPARFYRLACTATAPPGRSPEVALVTAPDNY